MMLQTSSSSTRTRPPLTRETISRWPHTRRKASTGRKLFSEWPWKVKEGSTCFWLLSHHRSPKDPSLSVMSHSTNQFLVLLSKTDSSFHLSIIFQPLLLIIFIRESYRTLSSLIQPGLLNKVIITGTPGIGKSLFLIYLLWKLVKEGKRKLFIYHPSNYNNNSMIIALWWLKLCRWLKIYFDGQGGVFLLDTIPTSIHQSFWNESLWCVFDAKYKTHDDLNKLPIELCTFVLSNSPQQRIVNISKNLPYLKYFICRFTKMELKAIAPLFPHVATKQLHKRLKILGGIPRTVLEKQYYWYGKESNTNAGSSMFCVLTGWLH